jgi:TonB family protein
LVDKSFEGLLLSLFLHAFLVVVFFYAKLPVSTNAQRPTEISFIEKPSTKSKAFVTETQPKDTFEQLKDQADFLSQFTKRVKKQIRAAKSGPTVNAAPRPSTNQQQAQRIAGLRQQREEDGIGTPGSQTNQAIRNVAIGQSSIAEYIPGIQEGSFTSLNTDQFTYYAFFARMGEQVRNRWVSNVRNYMARLSNRQLEFLSRMERHTQIEIILTPEGKFSSSILQASSGDRELDQTTIDAFIAAAPFPNPPHGMIEGDGFIHLRYGFLVYFRPPSFGPASN